MARRGQRLYKCEDCGVKSLHHWLELNRASRLRCSSCGSLRMNIVSEEAKRERADIQDMGRAAATYSGFEGPGKATLGPRIKSDDE